MDLGQTTRCCSAIALTLACSGALAAAPEPLNSFSFFPARTVWTLALNTALTASPAFSATSAYFPIEGDRLAAHDLATGDQLWIVSAPVRSEPATGDGLIFVAESTALVALREADGGVQWSLPFDQPLAAPLRWDHHWLIAADTSGGVHAFSAVDGRLIWHQSVGVQVHARPALAADRVYLPTLDGRVIALRIDTGDRVWEHQLGGAPNDILALDDRLYVGSNDNFLYCLESENGQIAWRWRTGGDVVGMPVVDEQRVYFVSLDNVLRGLSRKSGSQVWKRVLPFRPIAGPAHAGDALVVAGLDPGLLAFNAKDGTPAGNLPASGVLSTPPRIIDNPSLLTPLMIIVTNDIAKGATVTAMAHALEAPLAPFAPLPNPLLTASPTLPTR